MEPPPHCPIVVSLKHDSNNENQGIVRWDDPWVGLELRQTFVGNFLKALILEKKTLTLIPTDLSLSQTQRFPYQFYP